MRFIITTHARLAGVFLSRPGHFGNIPYSDDASAVAAARTLAGGEAIAVERERASRRLIAR